MHNETAPSLFLPKLAALLLLVVFLSGMVEIVCLATSAQKTNYSIVNETSKLISNPSKAHVPTTQISSQVGLN
jgi:hypothetical protein